jgi:hypothetical protein
MRLIDSCRNDSWSYHLEESAAEENLSVRTNLEEVTPEKRRRDAQTLLELMTRVTGESPRLWSSVIGLGQYGQCGQSKTPRTHDPLATSKEMIND